MMKSLNNKEELSTLSQYTMERKSELDHNAQDDEVQLDNVVQVDDEEFQE